MTTTQEFLTSILSLVAECQQTLQRHDNNKITLNDCNLEIFQRMEDIESDAQRLNAGLENEIDWKAVDG